MNDSDDFHLVMDMAAELGNILYELPEPLLDRIEALNGSEEVRSKLLREMLENDEERPVLRGTKEFTDISEDQIKKQVTVVPEVC